jgi:hypothetical protein
MADPEKFFCGCIDDLDIPVPVKGDNTDADMLDDIFQVLVFCIFLVGLLFYIVQYLVILFGFLRIVDYRVATFGSSVHIRLFYGVEIINSRFI